MKSIQPENIAEHSQHTAMVAHVLALIENKLYGGNVNADRTGMLAIFHETGEVLTGDLPTPIKYFSEEISGAYKNVEAAAEQKLLDCLPPNLRDDLEDLVCPSKSSREYVLVKYADKITAYIKCIEEIRSQNLEFRSAYKTIGGDLREIAKACPAVQYFLDNFVQAYYKNLDELM